MGIEPESADQLMVISELPSASLPAPASDRTKASQVLALLICADGATLAELVEQIGWLPHSTRAALTGLRKRGHTIERIKLGDQTCYRIVKAGTA